MIKTGKELQEIIEREIDFQFLQIDFKPKELYDPIKYVLKIGGKRLRPTLVLMACNLFSDDINKAIKPAIGVELFHNFSLLHDDIMDKSNLRRNMPTVHVKWNENTAILSGDAMSIIAFQFAAESTPLVLKEVLDIFGQISLQVCEGQQYDMNFEQHDIISVEQYLNMIELKTAVLIAGSLKIGALVGNADKSDAENLYQFGRNIGLAFQLQDDYLDVYGDTKVFGKNIGNDIVSNKKTFLLIKALEIAKGKQLEQLKYYLSLTNIDREEKINAVTEIYNQLNVKKLSQDKMEELFNTSVEYLKKVKVSDERKAELQKLAAGLMNREK